MGHFTFRNRIDLTTTMGLWGLTAALLAGGCLGEGDDPASTRNETGASARPGGDGDPSNPPEDLVSISDPLIACISSQNHGGDLFPRTFPSVLGCRCPALQERTSFTVWNTGNGSCFANGWATTDPRDCQVRVTINQSGGFANGTCNAQIESHTVSCPHNKCTTGTKLAFACPDACIGTICERDPFCCNNSWDSICVREVTTICGGTCP